ncbi:hypothetical protein [Lacisediminimonas profundi]|uniref:hypothetical protein n=1 Tax=Lacisediminimonas profundi TaxID=2603856 RepID=UPI00124B72E5|nr:hypothetical protein [Lacisediminimonas profundi]
MKHASSLEQERQALLEQIHASRAAYRRMLGQYDEPGHPDEGGHAVSHIHHAQHLRGMPGEFPRSSTMRWIVSHPYAIAGAAAGLAALIAIGPRRVLTVVRSAPAAVQRRFQAQSESAAAVSPDTPVPPPERDVHAVQRASIGAAALASLAGTVSMIMRDPARMQMAARAANAATQWLRKRRQRPAQAGGRRAGR